MTPSADSGQAPRQDAVAAEEFGDAAHMREDVLRIWTRKYYGDQLIPASERRERIDAHLTAHFSAMRRYYDAEVSMLREQNAAERAVTARLREALDDVVREYDARNEAFGYTEHKNADNEFNRARAVLVATPAAPCATCGGSGEVWLLQEVERGGVEPTKQPCPDCRPAAIAEEERNDNERTRYTASE